MVYRANQVVDKSQQTTSSNCVLLFHSIVDKICFYRREFLFYQSNIDEKTDRPCAAQVVLTPAESKRLIAKAVAILPEVKRALAQGTVIIALGTTNAFVVEEILGINLSKSCYTAGYLGGGELGTTSAKIRLGTYVLKKGKKVEMPVEEALKGFGPEDVIVKGANAIDPWGNAGVLIGSETGGTIGMALPVVVARRSHIIVPVGLEKLIPSVIEAASHFSRSRFKYRTGNLVGYMPLVNAWVLTETQALKVLCGVSATHVASGGIGGSEGSVVLTIEGIEEDIDRAFALVKALKGEPALSLPDHL